jgi:hypothetical protein
MSPFEKFVTAIEPFALTLTAIAGASLAGWINFSNKYVVGVSVFGFAILLIVKHVFTQVRDTNKKGK